MAPDPTENRPPPDGTASPVDDVAAARPQDERVAALLAHTIDVPVLAEAIERQEAADAADALEDIQDEAAGILEVMEDAAAANALAEMESPLAASVLLDFVDDGNAEYAGRLLSLMASDDAADFLQELGDEPREVVLAMMPRMERAKVLRLLRYPEESAAGLMTIDFLALRADMTVQVATNAIRHATIPEDFSELPVVDAGGRLLGMVALRDLLIAREDRTIGDLSETSVHAIRADLDQEAVALAFQRYDHTIMPVIDDRQRLLGVVTVDDVIDIIREEQTEDVQKTVGAGKEEAVYSSVLEKFRGRFRWLFVSLVIMLPSVLIVSRFEGLIGDLAVLAVLMPIVAALAGNAGHQALAVTLRGIVLDQVRADRVWTLLRREATAGFMNGLALGAVIGVAVWIISFTTDSMSGQLGAVIAVSMTLSLTVGSITGASVPLLMRRAGADPAQSSAIFLIMITDAIAFASFLGLAWVSYDWLVA